MGTKNCEEQEEVCVDTLCDEESREIFITGEITLGVYQTSVAAIRHLDKTRGNITLIINTPGGDVPFGLAISDTIRLAKNNVLAHCFGQCMSIGMTILQACDSRLSAPNCRFMAHDGSITPPELSLKDANKTIKEFQEINNQIHNSLVEKSSLTLSEVKSLCENEIFMNAEVAMGYGFLDGILGCPTKPAKKRKK
jgi:ATP-dependent Clp protease protease subunit